MTALRVYRDDGPLAAWIGRSVGSAMPLGEVLLTLLAAVPLVVVFATSGGTLPEAPGAAAVLGFVVLAGAGAGRAGVGRLAWVAPPLLRLLEYAFLIALTALADGDAVSLCFAVLGVLAFHHYDTVYRLRHQRVAPPAWTRVVGGGWDGRLLLAYGLALAGVLAPGLLAAAVVLAVIYVAESVLSWLRFSRAERRPAYEEEDEQAE